MLKLNAALKRDLLKRHVQGHDADPSRVKRLRPHTAQSNRVSQACKACASLKVKCDDNKPCNRCEQAKIQCEYSSNRQHVKKISASRNPVKGEGFMPPPIPIFFTGPPFFAWNILSTAISLLTLVIKKMQTTPPHAWIWISVPRWILTYRAISNCQPQARHLTVGSPAHFSTSQSNSRVGTRQH